jgi:membrane-bound serine protease (ClpP class)
MAWTIVEIILLVAAGLAIFLLETVIPSFGLLAVMGTAALVGAVALSFTISSVLGIAMIVILLVGVPLYLIGVFRVLPNTFIGRKLFLAKMPELKATGTPQAQHYESLVGQTGQAESALRPVGIVRIQGQRLPALAESGVIDKDATVKVIATDGMNLVVKAVTEGV